MAQSSLPFRQIHLDFHTGKGIPNVAADFSADAYADTLVRAHVNSVTTFARCHHGFLYYDSEQFPERIHPNLTNKNLLKEQIEACDARGIRVPIYITVQWDHYTSARHPEWLQQTAEGMIKGTAPFEAGFYRNLMVNSPYLDFLKAQTKEVLETLPTDGIFLDIVKPLDDSSRWTVTEMLEAGLEPSDPMQRMAYGLEVVNAFKNDMSAFVRGINPECGVFYNGGHIGPRHRAVAGAYSYFEIESLPSTTYWGYLHYPLAVRYGRTLGLENLSMTGKFHSSWGDFHSYKNQAALEYEVYRMLALGSKCSVGDQLHPDGVLDAATYDLIGSVYEEVEKKEGWCSRTTPLSDIAVLTPEAFEPPAEFMKLSPALEGLTLMLEESALQFDVADAESDWSAYKVLILPDEVPVDDALAEKLSAYSEAGGAIIASFASGMDEDRGRFTLKELGVSLTEGDAPEARGVVYKNGNYCEYLRPGELVGDGLVDTQYVMYIKGMPVAPDGDTEVLAEGYASYFDRTYKHFCSHRQTPSSGAKSTPAVVQNGNTIYFAHPLFTQYRENAPHWCKQLFLNALARVLLKPLIRHDSFSTLRLSLNEQTHEGRYVLHLLHYIPERRGKKFDTVENVIPVHAISMKLNVPNEVKAVRLVPGGEPLEFTHTDTEVTFNVPKLVGHQMVELTY